MNKKVIILLLAGFALLPPVFEAFAALGETENAITFRGDQRRIALPPAPVHVATTKGTTLSAAEASKLLGPVLRDIAMEVPSAGYALLRLTVEKSGQTVTVRLGDKAQGRSGDVYSLPADAAKLRRAIAGLARYAGLHSLQGSGKFPDMRWDIQVYRPSHAGADKALAIDNAFWEPVEVITVGEQGASKRYDESALLTFSFANSSRENLYVYVINYTDDGQVLPVLPPQAKSDMQNVVPHGQELDHPTLRLELGSPVERVRLIVSRVPLSVAHWAQEGYDADPAEFERKGQFPKPEDWASTEVVFIRQ